MVTVGARRQVAATPGVTWRTLTDWARHTGWIPLTRVHAIEVEGAPGTPGVGVGGWFVGRTGLGPLGFDDVMEITQWQPPGADGHGWCEVEKHGRVVLGGARFEVRPSGDGTLVEWTETVGLAPERLTRPFSPLIGLVFKGGLGPVLKKMAAEAAAEQKRADESKRGS